MIDVALPWTHYVQMAATKNPSSLPKRRSQPTEATGHGKTASKRGRPFKAADERKDDLIRVRVTPVQKATLQAAADRTGLDVSSWLRSVGLREAERLEREKIGSGTA